MAAAIPVKRVVGEPARGRGRPRRSMATTCCARRCSIARPARKRGARPSSSRRATTLWRAAFALPALGRHRYTAIAWVDAFATWRRGLERKLEAGATSTVELLEGAALVRAAFERGGHPALREAAEVLASDAPLAERIALATGGAVGRRGARSHRIAAARRAIARARGPRRARRARASPPGTSCSRARPRADGAHGTLRDAEERLAYVAELGFDIVYLPPIHPIGRAFRKGPDNTPTAGPGRSAAARGPSAAPKAATRRASRSSARSTTSTTSSRAARGRGLEVALDIAFQASPDHPWVQRAPELVPAPRRRHDPVRREPAEEVPGRLPVRLRERRLAARCGTRCATSSCSGSSAASACSASTTRTPSRSPFWEWCLARGPGALPRRDLPRRGVHAARS